MFDWYCVRTGRLFLSYSEHFSEHLSRYDRRCDRFVRVGYIARLDSVIRDCLLRRRGAMAAHHLPTIILVAGGGCGFDPRRR